ncbi:MAG: 50S ribosomal protein L5, partial [Clostridiales bacterium]|nr:50S ribosomal protein L5 [Clostridiales bacterium]
MAEKSKAKDKAPIAAAKAGKPVKSNNPDRYRLKKRYKSEIVPQLMKERGYKNINQVPKIEKIVLNMRLGDIKDNSKSIQLAQAELDAIAGQRSVLVKAKKSV